VTLWPFSRKSSPTPFSAANFAQLLAGVFGGGATKSGASVNRETALEVTAFLACVRVIAEGVAQVPWTVMRKKPGQRERLPAEDHPLWDVLHRKPNRWQTSFAFRETMLLHILASDQGAAFAYISRTGAERKIRELVLIEPQRLRTDIADDGTLRYVVTGRDQTERVLSESDVWHMRGPSWNGQTALSLRKLAREALGLAMSTEETQAKLHKEGVRTSGAWSVEGKLSKDQYGDLSAWLQKQAGSAAPLVLDNGAKWQPFTLSSVDAQHLETRGFQIREICRAMRVQPVMAMEAEKAAAYASVEQQFIAHVVHTLLPWYERIEQSGDVFLLTDDERKAGYYTFLNPTGLLRGAIKDTGEYISRLTERGVMTRNEARDMLDLNPLPGLDEPLTPVNLAIGAQPAPEPTA
jgi:HK97 family phage portal protein